MKRHLKLEPHRIKKQSGVWWYELVGGMEIHVENTAIDPKTGQAVFIINWNILERAIGRLVKQ